MGRTARFDQVFVTSLDADPVEQDVLTDVKSIITKEIDVETITADKIAISNTNPTKQISIGSNIFVEDTATNIVIDVTKGIRAERLYVNDKIGIAAPSATNEFQIGPNNEFVIDRSNEHLVTLQGNVSATNVLVSNIINVDDTLVIDRMGSNVLKVVGNTFSTNISIAEHLVVGTDSASVGSNVAVFQHGNVFVDQGNLTINGNLHVNGNTFISESATYQTLINLVVANCVIQQASTNNKNAPFDNALIMTEGADGSVANLVFGYQFSNNEFLVGRTQMTPGQTTIAVDQSNTVNLHVYGQMYADGNVGVANISTKFTLSVGSNVYFDDTGPNVFVSDGNVAVTGNVVAGGMRIGTLATFDPSATAPILFNENIKSNSIRTVGSGTAHSGIANLAPTNTLSIGAKIFANLAVTANVLTVLGNTATTELVTNSIHSFSNIVIHADRYGGLTGTSNALVLKSGSAASNVSSIEIIGASTSNTHQIIKMKTRNTERVRIDTVGRVGISNTHPTEKLTVAGNVHAIGGDGFIYGNTWGSASNTSSRMYSSHLVGENKIENIVAEGKGLNIYVSKTATMGVPKLTILESSNVGIGTATPKGRLHTSGGTVFINNEITNNGTYQHLATPLVVSNSTAIANTTDFKNVLELCREGGTAGSDGVRACFKMGKHTAVSSGTAHTQLNLCLASTNYETEVDVLSLTSDGRIGVGTTTPTAYLEIHASGAANPLTNGVLVHNFDGDSGDAILAAKTRILAGNVFTSYIQTNSGNDPRGWSTGVTGTDSDFRITQNIENNKDPSTVGLYISGDTGRVGINTDTPRGALDVAGNVVIGNELSFGGLTGDLFGNTRLVERRYTVGQSRTELVLFKGNDADTTSGPDRIRHIAAEHIFETYTSSQTFDDLVHDQVGDAPLVVTNDRGIVVIGGRRSDAANRGINTKLVVNGDIEFAGSGSFTLTGLAFGTTTPESGDSVNTIRSLLDGNDRRVLTFAHGNTLESQVEFARFNKLGRLGIGVGGDEDNTGTIDANVHIYNANTTDQTLLKLESPHPSSGTFTKKSGILLYTTENFGGYVKGFRDSATSLSGIVIGGTNSGTETDGVHITHAGNVGIGTLNPQKQLHVYDGMARIQSASSNATIELTTTAGSANIYADTTGNVYINPLRTGLRNTTFLNSNVEVIGDFSVDGALDLGNQVGIGLDGATANTVLHVNGGIITNSDQVASKKYSHSNVVTSPVGVGGQDIQFMFKPNTFYAKIIAVLRETSDVRNTSTMILDVSGGTHDGSTGSMYNIALGATTIMGATNSYPWSPTVTVGTRGINIQPTVKDDGRNFAYDLTVEVTSGVDGGLSRITKRRANDAALNTTNGGQDLLVGFSY